MTLVNCMFRCLIIIIIVRNYCRHILEYVGTRPTSSPEDMGVHEDSIAISYKIKIQEMSSSRQP